MMASTAKTYAKLGAFAILAFVGIVVAAFALGMRSVRAESIRYHTYFDESVQGLEVGAPVKYRGIAIGTVSAIDLAPDRRHVDVSLALAKPELARLGLAQDDGMAIAPDVRAQVGSQGITGVKLVDIEFFDPKTNPIERLPFAADPRTIPVATSTMKTLEESLAKALDRLPDLIDAAVASLGRIDRILDDFHGQHVPEALVKALGNMNGAISDLRVVLHHVDQAKIPEKTAKALDDMDQAIAKATLVLERFDGDAGLVASTQRASDSVGDLGKSVRGSTQELDRTLRELGDAARAVHDLADAIDRDPDMLVKGRAAPRVR